MKGKGVSLGGRGKVVWVRCCYTDWLEGHIVQLLGSEVERLKRWQARSGNDF